VTATKERVEELDTYAVVRRPLTADESRARRGIAKVRSATTTLSLRRVSF